MAAALTLAAVGAALVAAPEVDVDMPRGPEAVVWGGFAALPIVAGLVEVAKHSGFPDRFAGLLALVLGIAGGVSFAQLAGVHVATGLVQGIVVGLAASGAWSTSRNTLGIGQRPRAGDGGRDA